MKTEALPLTAYGAAGVLTAYLYDGTAETRERPVLIVCPGGGYKFLSERESEPVAVEFYNRGYTVYVLSYTVNAPFPTQLNELVAAVDYARGRHGQKTFVLGFSAGGHLTASLADFYTRYPALNARPDGIALAYPVISAKAGYVETHEVAVGRPYDGTADFDALDLDEFVTERNPPAYLWHTFADDLVPVSNILRFAAAMAEKKVRFELHVFPDGGHGLSLADRRVADENAVRPEVTVWTAECDRFFRSLL